MRVNVIKRDEDHKCLFNQEVIDVSLIECAHIVSVSDYQKVFCLHMNFFISKAVYCREGRIQGTLLQGT